MGRAGQAYVVEDPDGKCYGVFLGVRPNNKKLVNARRETFILPVDWSGDFPVFENGLVPMEPKLKMPKGVENRTGQGGFFPNGNFTFRDSFTSSPLDFRWIGVRGPREEFAKVTNKGLEITPFATHLKEVKPTATLFHRQQHAQFSAEVTLAYTPNSERDCAGITCYQSEMFYYLFGLTKSGDKTMLLLERVENGKSSIVVSTMIDPSTPITLKVEANGDDYTFSYATKLGSFTTLGGVVSGDILSTNVAGGFTGCLIGLYATSANDVKL